VSPPCPAATKKADKSAKVKSASEKCKSAKVQNGKSAKVESASEKCKCEKCECKFDVRGIVPRVSSYRDHRFQVGRQHHLLPHSPTTAVAATGRRGVGGMADTTLYTLMVYIASKHTLPMF
jgi:hypothetical protein